MIMRGGLQKAVGGVYPQPIATMPQRDQPRIRNAIRRPHVADAGAPRSEHNQKLNPAVFVRTVCSVMTDTGPG
jgi:hypothetical protein